jgi:hypothetical protein
MALTAGWPSPEKPTIPLPATVFNAPCPRQSVRNANPRKADRDVIVMETLLRFRIIAVPSRSFQPETRRRRSGPESASWAQSGVTVAVE